MMKLEAHLKANNQWIDSPTEGQAMEMFKLLPKINETSKRAHQNKFSAGLRAERRKKQKKNADADTDED